MAPVFLTCVLDGALRAISAALGATLALALASPAAAEDAQSEPPVAFSIRDTLDLWRNTRGGVKVGDTQLNKLQIAVTLNGDGIGAPGWRAHLHYFRTNGERLSSRIGDIQTASNIEALSVDRLMEAWVEHRFDEVLEVDAGLIDLNADFDSIERASVFINSSHGIAPDLSRSGVNGPSIFPVSALGVHAAWTPSKRFALNLAAFDGVPGDPAHPKAFATFALRGRDGALLIGQANWKFAEGAQASVGSWTYTAATARLDAPGARRQAGVYAFIEGPLPIGPGWSGWARAGLAQPAVATVGDYLGFGLVKAEPIPGRKDDQMGFAVARAGLGAPIRRLARLQDAETTFEATYQLKVGDHFAVQPDLQYVMHPASQAGIKDALVVGLRLVVMFKHPAGADIE